MPAGASAVTVMAAMAPRQVMNEWSNDPKEILETFAAEMRANQLHYSIYGGNYAVVIPKQLREHIQAAGWSKQDVAEFLFERARVRRGEWANVGKSSVVRDRASRIHPALDSPRTPARGRGGRSGGRFRRYHPTLDGQQNQGRHGGHWRLRRLRATRKLAQCQQHATRCGTHRSEDSS